MPPDVISSEAPVGSSPVGAPVLSTLDLGKEFGGFHALREVSVDVAEREILGIIGPNGAGKTTLFNLVAGAFRPSTGSVTFLGENVTKLPPHRRLRRGIARTFQLIHPFVSMTIRENVYTAAMGSGMGSREASRQADEMVDRLGLNALADKSSASINAVEGKRLEVARALATNPKMILLDEIFSGLNTEEVDELVRLVKGLRDDGLTVLVIEHNVRAIRAVADRVVAIDAGRVVSEGDPNKVLSDPHVIESYLGNRARA
jgi:branched-chain amino acid transport system ATP-binding protein